MPLTQASWHRRGNDAKPCWFDWLVFKRSKHVGLAVAGLSFIGLSFLFSAIDFTAKKRGHVAPARTKFAHGRTEARRVSFADLRAVRGEHLPLVRAGDLHRITALRAQSFKDRRRNPTHFGVCLSLE